MSRRDSEEELEKKIRERRARENNYLENEERN